MLRGGVCYADGNTCCVAVSSDALLAVVLILKVDLVRLVLRFVVLCVYCHVWLRCCCHGRLVRPVRWARTCAMDSHLRYGSAAHGLRIRFDTVAILVKR